MLFEVVPIGDYTQEFEANARLIAAAPDLLGAAELALSHLPYQSYFVDVREQLKAAIAKAKGEAPNG